MQGWLLGFSSAGKLTNKCQHLCQMGAGWNFCVPQYVVSFGDASHDLLRPRDHVSSGKEPQFPEKRAAKSAVCAVLRFLTSSRKSRGHPAAPLVTGPEGCHY